MSQPPITPVTSLAYGKLLKDVRREMERGVKKIEGLLEQPKVITCWTIGRKINLYLKADEQPRGAVGLFYQNFSQDSGINTRTLQQCEQFYRYFPKFKADKILKWSHYRFLLVEPDAGKRQAWIERIKREKISADELRLALMPPGINEETLKINLKAPVRGRLFTYRILRADDIENFDTPWFVDLGFANRKEAPAAKVELNNKYLYTCEKGPRGYRFKVTGARAEELFTYKAILRRIIDADTTVVLIDQGFSCWTEQTLRLHGIDAPEIDTLAGARAKKWVEDELKDLPFVIVKTYKDRSDKWDRYLVDVFYKRGESDPNRAAADGLWLNGRMVQAGMAKVWK